MVEYGPPLTVARLTLYDVAPLLAVQLRATWALPAVAERPVGADGGVTAVPPVGARATARKALFVPAPAMRVAAVPERVPLKPVESVTVKTGVPLPPPVT